MAIIYGYDIWYHIFHKCTSFQLRVLRRVCKTLYEWTNDDYMHKLYYELMHKEYEVLITNLHNNLSFKCYLSNRRRIERHQFDIFPLKTEEIIFNCTVPLDKGDAFLHIKGLIITGFNPKFVIDVEIGGNIINTIRINQCEQKDDALYYPLVQAGSLRIPENHNIIIHSDAKVLMLGEYKSYIRKDFDGNILNNGQIQMNVSGMSIPQFI